MKIKRIKSIESILVADDDMDDLIYYFLPLKAFAKM